MSVPRPTALVTGANGRLGVVVKHGLVDRGWAVRELVRSHPGADADVVTGSITDLDAMTRACERVSAIVHLAGVSEVGESWESCLDNNIHGTRTVLEAARAASVPRVILASSNHAAGYAARPEDGSFIPASAGPRPDSFYGVSKVAMEALGSFYADEYGLETVSIRIGSCFPRPTNTRSLSTWLSHEDLLRLVEAALVHPWQEHRVVWGISRNTRRWWSLDEGERIGYFPKDDAEIYAANVEESGNDFVGGSAPPFYSGAVEHGQTKMDFP